MILLLKKKRMGLNLRKGWNASQCLVLTEYKTMHSICIGERLISRVYEN